MSGFSAVERSETPIMFWSVFSKRVVREFIGYDPQTMNGGYRKRTLISTDRLDFWLAAVVHLSVESGRCVGNHQKQYD